MGRDGEGDPPGSQGSAGAEDPPARQGRAGEEDPPGQGVRGEREREGATRLNLDMARETAEGWGVGPERGSHQAEPTAAAYCGPPCVWAR